MLMEWSFNRVHTCEALKGQCKTLLVARVLQPSSEKNLLSNEDMTYAEW